MKSFRNLLFLALALAVFACRPPKAPAEEAAPTQDSAVQVETAPAALHAVGDTTGADTLLLND